MTRQSSPPTDWIDKDPIIKAMRSENPPQQWTTIGKVIGVSRETVRIHTKYALPDYYEITHQILNR